MTLLSYILLLLFLVIFVMIVFFTLKNGIGPTPSCRNTPHTLDALLPKTLIGNLMEFGCGWGGVALYLAKKYPDNPVIAWENSPIPWLVATLRQKIMGLKNLEIHYGDFHKASWENCGLIYCYLCTGQMKKLKERFERFRPQDTCCLVSSTFSVPGWIPASTYQLGDWYGSRVFVYMLSHHPSSLSDSSCFSSK